MEKEYIVSRDDFLFGSMIAILLMFFFIIISPGPSLLVTFVPGIILTWLVFTYLHFNSFKIPSLKRIIQLYYLGICVQLLHFAEEHSTEFYQLFPELFGAEAFSEMEFVVFNMIAYGVFILAPLLVYLRGRRFFLIPMLFFIIYGMIGNAITHSYLTIMQGSYFPGVYTAIIYFFFGPYLLSFFISNKRHFLIFIFSFIAVLIIGLSLTIK